MNDQEKQTFFAPAERATMEELRQQIDLASHNPVIDAVLGSIGGMLAVLNDKRQVIALNQELLTAVGLEDGEAQLGLRLGQIVGCLHADKAPAGCGTTRYCASCGAAVAMVSSLCKNRPVDEKCILSSTRNGKPVDLVFKVHAAPILLTDQHCILLFLQDITETERNASLERIFLHDMNNLVTGIQGLSETLQGLPVQQQARALLLSKLSRRLVREVEVQRAIYQDRAVSLSPSPERVSLPNLVVELQGLLALHPASRGKQVAVDIDSEIKQIYTDPGLLLRVLLNMAVNALEATEPGDEVKLWSRADTESCSFHVWNASMIPAQVQPRIFQLYFSTKTGNGRGIGTYIMKLLGEDHLGGQVQFHSDTDNGTTFSLRLPYVSQTLGGYSLQ